MDTTMTVNIAEWIEGINIFHILTSGEIDTGVVSWNGLTGVVNATADDVLLGTQHLFLTNDGGTTDNLSGMPTIIAINAAIAGKLNLSGGTMTGFLALNADPITNLEAATKQYVDNSVSSVTITGTTNQINVLQVGDDFTLSTPQDINTDSLVTFGGLTLNQVLSGIIPSIALNSAQGSYINFGNGGRNIGVQSGGNFFISKNLDYDASTNQYVYTATN